MSVTERVNGAILWANIHLLFWLSLVPFMTAWVGEHHAATAPTAVYGGVLLAASLAYWILQRAILNTQGPGSVLATAVGRDLKGKTESGPLHGGDCAGLRPALDGGHRSTCWWP